MTYMQITIIFYYYYNYYYLLLFITIYLLLLQITITIIICYYMQNCMCITKIITGELILEIILQLPVGGENLFRYKIIFNNKMIFNNL